MQGIEIWKEAYGCPGYWVSHTGKVKNKLTNKTLTGTVHVSGYKYVRLSTPEGKTKTISMHTLTMRTFVGLPLEGYATNHKDGNKTNNDFLFNLEYLTTSDNNKHSFRTLGRERQTGLKNIMGKLTDDQVAEIRALHLHKVPVKEIANKFGIKLSYAYLVTSGVRR